jgi:hypothetical protein
VRVCFQVMVSVTVSDKLCVRCVCDGGFVYKLLYILVASVVELALKLVSIHALILHIWPNSIKLPGHEAGCREVVRTLD